jgi:hypothetical protein
VAQTKENPAMISSYKTALMAGIVSDWTQALSYLDNLSEPGVQVLSESLSPTAWNKQVSELVSSAVLWSTGTIA